MSPPSTHLFLVCNGRCLGAEIVSEFPIEQLPGQIEEAPDAIFTDHFRPEAAGELGPSRVHTAVVERSNDREWLLGMIEPDGHGTPSEAEQHFCGLARQFRTATMTVKEIAGRVGGALESSNPGLIVNRASGRVLAANSAAVDLLNTDVMSVVDQEYSSFARRLSLSASSRGLQMNNLTLGDMHLTTVTILPERRRFSPPPCDNFFSEFFVHTMRNKLGAIMVASSHLESLAAETEEAEGGELAGIILGEATELNRHLDRMQLLVSKAHLATHPVGVDAAIANAASQVGDRHGVTIDTVDLTDEEPTIVEAPSQALEFLLEAVLNTHALPLHGARRTTVTLTETDPTVGIRIVTELNPTKRPPMAHRRWHNYAIRLADAIGATLATEETEADCLTSTLTIPKKAK